MKKGNTGNKARAIAILLALVLIIAGLGWLSDGFKNWSMKDWFSESTARAAAQNKLNSTAPGLPNNVESDLNINANYENMEDMSYFLEHYNEFGGGDDSADFYSEYYDDNLNNIMLEQQYNGKSFQGDFNGINSDDNYVVFRICVDTGKQYVLNYEALYGRLEYQTPLYEEDYESRVDIMSASIAEGVKDVYFADVQHYTPARNVKVIQSYVNNGNNLIKFKPDTEMIYIRFAIWDKVNSTYENGEGCISFSKIQLFEYDDSFVAGYEKQTIKYLNTDGLYVTKYLYVEPGSYFYEQMPSLPNVQKMTFSHWLRDGDIVDVTSTGWEQDRFYADGQERTYVAAYTFEQLAATFKYKNAAGEDIETVKNFNFHHTLAESDYPTANLSQKYNFTGWSVATGTVLTGNTTITANYTLKTFSVTFKDWDGSTIKTETVEYGATAAAPTAPTRLGHTFTGWDKTFTNITANTTITAQYEINSYTVIFKNWDGTVLKTETVTYGGSATAPANPTRPGYAFTKWDNAFNNIIADTTIMAQFGINVYTVIFKNWDGSTLKTENVEYGKDATAPTVPPRTGYAFKGWDKALTNITANATITAQFEINSYTVIFKNHDGAVLKTETVTYGGSATAPTVPPLAGYKFTGWDNALTNITADTTITAQFEKNVFTVKFYYLNIKGETISKTVEAAYGTLIADILPDIPEVPGKIFTGWSIDGAAQVVNDMKIAVSYNNEFIEIPVETNIKVYVAIAVAICVALLFILCFIEYNRVKRR